MSSKRRQRRKSCDGKQRYDNHIDANKAMWSLMQSTRFNGGKMQVYKCKFCGHYHIGHLDKRAKTYWRNNV